MISTVKLFCVAIIYFIAISVANLDKVTEVTSEIESSIKEYIVDNCTTVTIKSAYTLFLINKNIQDYPPFKKEKLWQ